MASIQKFFHRYFLIKYAFKTLSTDIIKLLQQKLTDVRFHLIINIGASDSTAVIGDLFRYIADTTEFDHVIYNGSHYYEKSNQWQNTDVDNRPLHDEDEDCELYMERIFNCGAKIFPNADDVVKYVFKMDPENYEDGSFVNVDFVNKISGINPKKILLVGYKKLIIRNPHGINYDHRGSTHCNIYLKMHDEITTKKVISLYRLCNYFYKIKSHKWDKWYELYCRVKTSNVNGVITVDTIFDHGS